MLEVFNKYIVIFNKVETDRNQTNTSKKIMGLWPSISRYLIQISRKKIKYIPQGGSDALGVQLLF